MYIVNIGYHAYTLLTKPLTKPLASTQSRLSTNLTY